MAIAVYRNVVAFGFSLASIMLAFGHNSHERLPKQLVLEKDIPKVVNMFTGCLIHLLNFPGENLNGQSLVEPIILIRHNAPFAETSEYCWELIPSEISSRNKTAIDMFARKWKSKDYFNAFPAENLGRNQKNTNCEARIFLDPPTEDSSPNFYGGTKTHDQMLKHPFWVPAYLRKQEYRWRKHILSYIFNKQGLGTMLIEIPKQMSSAESRLAMHFQPFPSANQIRKQKNVQKSRIRKGI